MLIAIPSKGRAGKTTSDKVLTSGTLFVPESEYRAYSNELHPETENKIIPIPDSIRGITPTRNWILDYAEKLGESRVVFVDDDVMEAGYHLRQLNSLQRIRLTDAQWVNEFSKLFDLTESYHYRIWGVCTIADPMVCRAYRPFIWHTYVTASCMGMHSNTGLRFDESFIVKEDYELCLRCLRDDGGVVGARYLYWQNKHWKTAGGCKEYRTDQIEIDAITRLIQMYPGLVKHRPNEASEHCIQLNL